MSRKSEKHLAREKALLDRLEERSQKCPGLFPVQSRLHWRNLARLALGMPIMDASSKNEEASRIWPVLENFDRQPDQATELLTRLLAAKQPGPVSTVSPDPKATAREREAAIDALLTGGQTAEEFPATLTNGLQ